MLQLLGLGARSLTSTAEHVFSIDYSPALSPYMAGYGSLTPYLPRYRPHHPRYVMALLVA